MRELPYAGMTRVRFQGTVSARQGHPQLGVHGNEWASFLQEKNLCMKD
jgi:hypothetical protein